MYKKALNFNKSTDIFWKNTGPLTINYIPTLSSTKQCRCTSNGYQYRLYAWMGIKQ